MKLQDIGIDQTQHLLHVRTVIEKCAILFELWNVLANLLVSIQKGVQRLCPGTGSLIMAMPTLENQKLIKLCWKMAPLPGVKISLVPIEFQLLDFDFRAIRHTYPDKS